MNKKSYVFMLTNTDRKRHEHIKEKGKIIGFVVQYEMLYKDKWVPVIRYDTAHGFVHKDLINPDGSKEKIFIGGADLNEVMNIADKDINENWEKYKDRYLRRIKT
ncbi:MAG: hypothetical protein M1381_10965 [Deltaproteobacteria bacterium]|nr:hypothetical protein [Deltaproteobacteria bacterium]